MEAVVLFVLFVLAGALISYLIDHFPWLMIVLAVLAGLLYVLYRLTGKQQHQWKLARRRKRALQYEQYKHEAAEEILLDRYYEAMDKADEIAREEDTP